MIGHYLKIAWRNLLKYRTQSIISIVGLSIGFTAFVFTLSWIRYESGYDKHNPDAERIYRVFLKDSTQIGGVKKLAPIVLSTYLKEHYPEIESATSFYYSNNPYWEVPGTKFSFKFIQADTSFLHVFYPEINIAYPEIIPPWCNIFTQKSANKLGLRLEDTGQRIDSIRSYLLDIVPDMPHPSNVPFDIIMLSQRDDQMDNSWNIHTSSIYILVKKGVDHSLLKEKLEKITRVNQLAENVTQTEVYSCKLVPLRELRTTHPDTEVAIRYQHLRLFAGVSLLVILCAFFNYLMLFIHKIRIRQRELVLHKVNGAGDFQLLTLFFCEFVTLLLIALAIGLSLTELLYPHFIRFSMLEAPKSFFWREALLFGVVLLAMSTLFAYIPVRYIVRGSIRENLMQGADTVRTKNRFSRVTITLQLIISSFLIFTTTLFFYQYNYLNSDEIGFDRFNISSIITYPNDIPMDVIKKVPGVEDVIRYGGDFLPKGITRYSSMDISLGSDRSETVNIQEFSTYGPEFVEFFDIELLEGRNIYEGEKEACLINKTASLLLNSHDSSAVKRIFNLPVVGVIADMYIDSPLMPVFPSIYKIPTPQPWRHHSEDSKHYVYRYAEGQREATEKEIKRLATEEFGIQIVNLMNMEEIYAEYTKSERYLLILLSVMTGVAILIAVFGAYSIITLTCRRRRKEIAIRKVNGATVREIMRLFLREYLLITLVACMVSFPAGVLVMQRWLEQYTRRVSMEWWLFAALLLLMVLLVLASVLFQVVRAARENPSEVVKSE